MIQPFVSCSMLHTPSSRCCKDVAHDGSCVLLDRSARLTGQRGERQVPVSRICMADAANPGSFKLSLSLQRPFAASLAAAFHGPASLLPTNTLHSLPYLLSETSSIQSTTTRYPSHLQPQLSTLNSISQHVRAQPHTPSTRDSHRRSCGDEARRGKLLSSRSNFLTSTLTP